MSLYDAAKDAVKLAQKVDNIELIKKLLDVQQQALEMQEKQQKQQHHISKLEKEVEQLNNSAKYVFASEGSWLIDPKDPNRRLCAVCTRKLNIPVPLNGSKCFQCGAYY